MKKYILTLLAAASLGAVQAQKNTVLVYGDISYSASKDAAETKYKSFSINPSVGYQFNKCFTVGLTGGYNSSSSEAKYAPFATKGSAYHYGVFARGTHYVTKHIFFFDQLELGVHGVNETKTGSTVNAPRSQGFYASLTPNIGIDVYKGWALNFGFGGITYSNNKVNALGAKQSSNFNINFGQQFHFGISKNINCNKKRYGNRSGLMDDVRMIDTRDDEEDTTPEHHRKHKKDQDED